LKTLYGGIVNVVFEIYTRLWGIRETNVVLATSIKPMAIDAFVNRRMENQQEARAIQEVLGILSKYVTNAEAKVFPSLWV
jgi:hypothetical protein